MPFSMIHLCVANEVLKKTNKIKNIPDFYMGSIVPDAVHFRENFDTEMKKYSHFVPDPYKWGTYKDNDNWMKLVFENKRKHVDDVDIKEKYSFYMGYYTHVITDIANNIYVWQPFVNHNNFEDHNGLKSDYHMEAFQMDQYLYQTWEPREEVFEELNLSNEFNFEDRILPTEVRQMKDNMIHKYDNLTDKKDVSKFKHCTLDNTKILIEESTKLVIDKLLI